MDADSGIAFSVPDEALGLLEAESWIAFGVQDEAPCFVFRVPSRNPRRMTYRRGSGLGVAYHAALDDRRRGLIYWAIVTIGRNGHRIAIHPAEFVTDDEVLRELVLGLLAGERYEDRSLVVMPYAAGVLFL